MQRIIGIIFCLSLFCLPASSISATGVLTDGYGTVRWGEKVAGVQRMFPGGSAIRLGDEVIYRQTKLSGNIARRTFGFKNDGLYIVALSFDGRHVARRGIENILAEQLKIYGQGVMDRSQAPHLLHYIWEGKDTRITFSYAPRFPETTALRFEQKQPESSK